MNHMEIYCKILEKRVCSLKLEYIINGNYSYNIYDLFHMLK